ncbi:MULTISPECIES: pyruvate kinase [Limibacillus]|jgi:pyruvate kinase|uniref:Pyruvate kinase n=1 Tax=Limibacillus halophilus TaxID=1579333 RepID=A0A839SSG2_9PROT|nr:pyruvate kinase [Limibacillus halophilus]MBB3064724.1 pyruvate kinase [Limibacillus halophilus]
MRRNRKAKIVATLGPASSDEAMIRKLFMAGVDVFRLNFSHGSHEEHKARFDIIRSLEKETGRPIAILADLQGPKLRVGKIKDGSMTLKRGDKVRLDLKAKLGEDGVIPLPHKEIFAALAPKAPVLMDDGNLRLEVISCDNTHAMAKVITGGPLSNHKGVNVPGVVMPISPITTKDRKDLRFALQIGVDWIALSFVQRPEDVAEARRLIAGRAAIMIKIEKPQAVERLEELVEVADAVMVARGDLGVELPPEDVPDRQKEIIEACRLAGKPVVVATQMLDSMVESPAPTRAEASDVATAVYDGADAVMLSAESAAGNYPKLAVEMMDRIIKRTEHSSYYRKIIDALHPQPEPTAPDAISHAAAQVAATLGASAIVCYTTSGSTSLRAGRERPRVPILTVTASLETARRLAVAWGLHCVHTADARSFSEMVQKATRLAVSEGFARKGDKLVITAGVPFGTPGATNILRIAWVEG